MNFWERLCKTTWLLIDPDPLCSPLSTHNRMLITKTYHDVPSALDSGKPIRIFVIAPTVPGYPQAKFPGRSVLADPSDQSGNHSPSSASDSKVLSAFLRSIRSLARSSVSLARLPVKDTLLVGSGHQNLHGVIDLHGPACPSTYHEFEGPEPIPYDTEGKSTTFHLSR